MSNLYERITDLCKTKGVSRSRMCLELGLSKSTMSDMKSGRKKGVSAITAQKIADYFGVTVGYLLGAEDVGTKKSLTELRLSEGEQMLINLFRQVPDDQKELVLQMIRAALGRT